MSNPLQESQSQSPLPQQPQPQPQLQLQLQPIFAHAPLRIAEDTSTNSTVELMVDGYSVHEGLTHTQTRTL